MTRVPSAYVSAYLQLTRISNFETSSHLRAHSMRKKTAKFCMVIKLDVKQIFTLSNTNANAQSDCRN